MKQKIIIITTLLAVSMPGLAQTDTTVIGRVSRHYSERESMLQLAWENPAVKQWQHGYSVSDINLSWQLRHEDESIISQMGNHETTLAFDAKTYMKHGASTLWGEAGYHNGRQRGIRWNETSDIQVVHPYLLADSVSTQAMKVERYDFMGGYAADNGKIAWGATIGYKAGLYYRNVDPRPRNVTADLDLSAGLGVHCGSHVLAASLKYKKYKQTNNVAFYSEMGSDKLYHLTGLTNDYGRFAGTGYSTYYKGNMWAASVNAHPFVGQGLSLSIVGTRLALDNILTSINKLPMAHLTDNALSGELAWLRADWGVRSHLTVSRRVGTENIFGDPAAQVYLKIGSLDNYHENRFEAALDGVWQHHWGKYELGLHPQLGYHHLNIIYSDPNEQLQVNDASVAIRGQGSAKLGRTLATLSVGGEWILPTSSKLTLNGTKDELAGLQRAIENDFTYLSNNRIAWTTALSVTIPLTADYALRAGIDWWHGRYTACNRSHNLNTTLSFIF